jgi:transcription elongation GreA/GreB family factor|tara:strand:- start:470 stop:913 length:444 start_codon:yes stop_codon:yes gene_type:complete
MKKRVVDFITILIKDKTQLLKFELDSINKEKNNLKKSSAGDKFEISRALMQTEYDKIHNQLLILKNQLRAIKSISLSDKKKKVGVGSFIKTNKSFYFISIGLGKQIIDNNAINIISLSSPIGKLLNNKKKGDKIVFNNKEELIENIY